MRNLLKSILNNVFSEILKYVLFFLRIETNERTKDIYDLDSFSKEIVEKLKNSELLLEYKNHSLVTNEQKRNWNNKVEHDALKDFKLTNFINGGVYNDKKPLIFIIRGNGYIKYTFESYHRCHIKYKINDAKYYSDIKPNAQSNDCYISVNYGDIVYFVGNNLNYYGCRFYVSCPFDIEGHLSGLLKNENEAFTFRELFQNNTNLYHTNSLILPDKTYQSCYMALFKNCSNLVAAPVLKALHIEYGAYSEMFYNCNNLNNIVFYGETRNNLYSWEQHLNNWVNNVNENGVFYKTQESANLNRGASGIPNNWTIEYLDEA